MRERGDTEMTTPAAFLNHTIKVCAATGFISGATYAILRIAPKPHVREFQSGATSEWMEKALAIAQRTGLETLGFALLGGLFAIIALAIGRVGLAGARRRTGGDISKSAKGGVTLAQCATSAFFVISGAFLLLVTTGTWLAGEFLPFLGVGDSIALSALLFAGILVPLLIFSGIVARIPFAAHSEPAASGLASAVVAFGFVYVAQSLLLNTGGNWRETWRLATVSAALIATIPAAATLGRVLASPLRVAGTLLVGGRLFPKPVFIVFSLLAAGCAVVFISLLNFSEVPKEVKYGTVPKRGDPPGPNVILITIDTLRADHLGCYGFQRPTSPFMDSLAADGTRFDQASAAAPWTKPATATILTGLYPSRHGALYHGSNLNTPEGMKTLAETMQEKGYVTAGFVSNPNIKKIFQFNRGFDEYFDSPVEDTLAMAAFRESIFGNILKELSRYQFNWKYQNDVAEVNRHAFSWLDQNHSRPFFLYLHYIDPHEPYSPPEAYEKQFAQDHGLVLHNNRKRKVGMDLYDGEIRYTDDNLKILADRLKALKAWDNTIIIITSDHGEEFFEHGALGHGFSLYQEVVHVPLIMHGPGIKKGHVVKEPVGIVDLAATVLDVAATGIKSIGDGSSFAAAATDPNFVFRKNLFLEDEFGENENDTRSFVMTGIRIGPWKFIINEWNAYRPPGHGGNPRHELYDLKSDPGEMKNVFESPEHKDLIKKLLEDMGAHAEWLYAEGMRDAPPAMMTPEIMEELRNLGYAPNIKPAVRKPKKADEKKR